MKAIRRFLEWLGIRKRTALTLVPELEPGPEPELVLTDRQERAEARRRRRQEKRLRDVRSGGWGLRGGR